jgi:F0F1-type ATP synthase assembly protein I
MSPEPPHHKPTWIRYGGIGVEFAAAVAGFAAVGYWVDLRWETRPWGVVIGAGLGLIGGTYNLVRQSLAAFKTYQDNAGKEPDRQDRISK